MLILALYLLATIISVSWVVVDNDAVAVYEVFKRRLHGTARDLGMYWMWLVQGLLRAALLLTCLIAGIFAAIWMLQMNPWDLGWVGRASLFTVMVACSIATIVLPQFSAYLRVKRFLSLKAAELTNFVSCLSTSEGVEQQLEPVEQDVFGGVDGWTAWHPRKEGWDRDPFWEGLVPVLYLRQDTETSLIIPVDFERFLAWKLPDGSVTPGKLMPIRPRCCVKTVGKLRGREGWSVVNADLNVEDLAA